VTSRRKEGSSSSELCHSEVGSDLELAALALRNEPFPKAALAGLDKPGQCLDQMGNAGSIRGVGRLLDRPAMSGQLGQTKRKTDALDGMSETGEFLGLPGVRQ